MTHRIAAVLTLATTALVGACAAPSAVEPPPIALSVERPAPGPLWAYLDQVDARLATQVNEDRRRACVADAGFTYWPDDPNNELTQDTLEFARRWGYGGLSLTPTTPAAHNAAYARTLPAQDRPRYDEAIDTCAIAAVEEPADGWEADPDFAGLRADLEDLVLATVDDPRVHAADAPWSACMADAGYDVGSPDEAEDLAAAATDGGLLVDPQVQEAEIALAVADLTCRASTGYDVATRAAWHAVQQEFVDAHRDQLDALVAAHRL